MARRATWAVPLGLSAAGHGVVLALMFLGGRFSWPAPPIPIEVRPAHRTVKRVGPVEKRGDRRAPDTAKPDAKPKAKPTRAAGAVARPKTPEAKPAPPPPETTDLSPFAPDDAHLVVLLRMDKLRRSPHRAGAEALLAALPDWTTLVAGSGVSPIDDFEALLIATADPHDVTATFLAARYHDSPKVRALVARKLPPYDPRVFRVLAPGLTVLTQPADADRLAGAATDMGDPRRDWLAQLEQFDRVAQGDDGPALVVTLADAPALIHLGAGLPTPQAVALAATAEASPSLRVRVVFAGAAEAQAFARAWPEILARYRTATALLGLAHALDGLRLSVAGNDVELTGRIPEAQTRLGLGFARALLPPPPPGGALDAGTAPQ